jgi:hypothetical protein
MGGGIYRIYEKQTANSNNVLERWWWCGLGSGPGSSMLEWLSCEILQSWLRKETRWQVGSKQNPRSKAELSNEHLCGLRRTVFSCRGRRCPGHGVEPTDTVLFSSSLLRRFNIFPHQPRPVNSLFISPSLISLTFRLRARLPSLSLCTP